MSRKYSVILVALLSISACDDILELPDQQQFSALTSIVTSPGWYEDAFVRLYKAPLGSENLNNFTHPWLVVKAPSSYKLLVFELRQSTVDQKILCNPFDPSTIGVDVVSPTTTVPTATQYCGHVHLVTGMPAKFERSYYGVTGFVVGQLRGNEAVPTVDFLISNNAATNYLCKVSYNGTTINSNTFVRWVLESTQWDVNMGFSSWGQQFWQECL